MKEEIRPAPPDCFYDDVLLYHAIVWFERTNPNALHSGDAVYPRSNCRFNGDDTLGSDEFDLVILNRAPISLVGRILRNRKVLVDKFPHRRHQFESRKLREFFDFSRKEEAILQQRFG